MRPLTLFAFSAAIVLSQTVERVLPFTQLQTPAQMAEAATVIRSMTEIRDLAVAAEHKTMTLSAEPAPAALAEWLFSKLDRNAAGGEAPIDYRPVTGGDDLVRVFYFQTPMTVADCNERATIIRALLDLRKAFVSMAAGVFVVRGTQDRMEAARWLFDALGQESFHPGADVFRIHDPAGNDTIRLFAVAETVSKPELESTAAEVRMATLIKRIYSYRRLRAIAARGTYAQTEQAAGLINKP